MTTHLPAFRYPDGRLPNVLALLYAVGGYMLGIAGLTASAWWLNALAIVLLAHALVIAAYLIHECAHNTILADNRWNARLGAALMWLTGASYGRYEDIRHKHFRHHVDRADVVAFDFRPLLPRFPRLFRLIRMLEWAYVPAVDLMMHALVIVLPFRLASRRDRRARVLTVLAIRAGRALRPRLRATQHLFESGLAAPSLAQPADAQLRLSQCPPRAADRPLASAAGTASSTV